MPPKTTKVQPAKASSGGKGAGGGRAGSRTSRGGGASASKSKGKSNGQVTTLPPIAGATEPPPPVHENDEYNMYDLDGHRIQSPEPTTRWGKFKWKARKWWRGSAAYRKKRQFHKWMEERRERKKCVRSRLIVFSSVIY